MKAGTQYFRVVNLEKYQHYTKRNPPWIKLHASTLEDYDFGRLQDASKMHLCAIWLLASRTGNKIPWDSEWIARRINATAEVDLSSLQNAGFIELIGGASNSLATRLQSAMPETENRDREQRQRTEKISCAAPSQKPKVAALIPACSNQQFVVTESKQAEYRTAYPGVDVTLELRSIRQWCLDNPTRKKTLRGVPRFLNAWLSKAQNSGRRSKKPQQTAEERLAEIDAEEAALKGMT